MIDRRLFLHFDWVVFLVTIFLCLIGILNIYSAALMDSDNNLYEKQLIWFSIGLALMILATLVNYIHLERLAYPIYIIAIILLISTILTGRTAGGAKRWLSIGFASFQPSEFAKIAIILILSKYFSAIKIPFRGLSLKELIVPSVIAFIPFILIIKQPDMGTAVIIFLIFASMVIFAKVRLKLLIGITAISLPLIPIAWHFLKDYQKARLMSFLDPTLDPLGTGYHIMQSKIAIGSGGIIGNGFTNGTQGQLRFLPEHHTDFIFSVLAEEWGFIGSFIVLILYFVLVLWGLNIAQNAKDRLGAFLAFGVSFMFLWHILINIGMVTGMLPVVGVPLPFMSYGGSFLITTMIGAGILANVSMRRFIF
ncbi:MAG: rod shape-determining protein RodA [Deltaproteobacteria bacterium RIFCSPLOWO2_12_FULL_43_16]|nr:MAG: rod shape-determining protein RodA [Deltaproteobacteria bacterium GWA2_43_19]OGQ12425.1 MAG: rod shape-determining protein RodA [Deltaproteobacteria bacterium RIFCSPHIGHO2_02_FULL_43_33]OGQ40651.1 MAG: rod shape-determining protein RodA [Deltaproteobacteria bacterium RIFCSPLOWO2_01_FULL_42_9]OGQ59398.1 MAG: rod shape-determining protein RodA [Deltaproteobacteria bacterium RIFCSPLOWO2_12_FULL_43_16]HBR18044.1 rod shape-determining protein RodA [Deltaproteobacteria bacterium]